MDGRDLVIRVMIVEEMGLLRGALSAVIHQETDMEVVAEVPRADEALAVARECRPDVMVLDVDLGDPKVTELLHRFGAELPDCSLVVLTRRRTPLALRRALEARVRGFVSRDLLPEDLVQMVRSVARGERVIDPAAAVAALWANSNPLSTREREILRLIEAGLSTKETAARLFLAQGTVRNHLAAAIRKTGTASRAEAVERARDAGWL
jgi:two-component system response regulator DesR